VDLAQTVVLFTYLSDCFLSMNWFSRQQILFCDIQNHLRHFRHTYSVMKLPCKMHVKKKIVKRGFFYNNNNNNNNKVNFIIKVAEDIKVKMI
jgi:hypothetical protein